MIHNLKCWPRFFREVETGVKRFDIRKNDRGFQVGDGLKLWEWDETTETYTGRYLMGNISYILDDTRFGLQPGWVCLSINVACLGFGMLDNLDSDSNHNQTIE